MAAAAKITAMGWPPVKGIIQSARTLKDRSIDSMSLEDFAIPIQPKLNGTLNPQKTFSDANLDFFTMLSSAANIVGTRGQANYNSGNAAQDALAQASKSKECHYLSFSPSMIEGTSTVKDAEIRKALHRSGLDAIKEADMDAIFEYILSPTARADSASHIVAGLTPQSLSYAETANGNVHSPFFTHVLSQQPLDPKPQAAPQPQNLSQILSTDCPEDALAYTTAAVTETLPSLTYVDSASVDLDKPIAEFGLDSLIAFELRNWIKREFGAALQSLEISNEAGIRMLAGKMVQRVNGFKKVNGVVL